MGYCLYAKLSKCEFWLFQVVFVGHVVSAVSIKVVLAKVKAVLRWEQPTLVKKIHNFLGLVV